MAQVVKDPRINDLLQRVDLSEEEKDEVITVLSTATESERNSILQKLEGLADEKFWALRLNAGLQNIEIFERKNKLDYLEQEYVKIMVIAEKMGNNKLFERMKEKLEALKIKLAFKDEQTWVYNFI